MTVNMTEKLGQLELTVCDTLIRARSYAVSITKQVLTLKYAAQIWE